MWIPITTTTALYLTHWLLCHSAIATVRKLGGNNIEPMTTALSVVNSTPRVECWAE